MRCASRFGVLLSIAVLSIGAAACGSDSSEPESGSGTKSSGNTETPREGVTKDTINYGLVYDQTGPQTVSQTPWAHGFLTQIEKANDAGGINGRKIEILDIDEKAEVPVGVAGYKKLLSQTPVVGITGYGSSSVQEAVLPQFEKDKMPLVGPQSITKAALVPFKPSVFGIIAPYADQIDVIMGYMNEKLDTPTPNVAIFRLTASSGIEVGELVQSRIDKSGGKVVSDQQMDVTATSADAQVQKIVAAKPDYIVMHTAPTQSAAVLKAMQKLGSKIPIISTFAGGGPTAYQSVPKEVGELMEYTAAVTPADIDTPGNAALVADAKKYGYSDEANNTAYTFGYISGMAVVEGLKNAGADLNRESYIKGLEQIKNLDTGGLSEPITFGPKDHIGLSATRPYKYNYDTKKFEAVGEFTDYTKFITKEYGG